MIGIQELLVTVANAPKESAVVVVVGGKSLPVASAEVSDGKVVITAAEQPAEASNAETPTAPAAEASTGDKLEFDGGDPK